MLFPRIWKNKWRRTYFESLCKNKMFLTANSESTVKNDPKSWIEKRMPYIDIEILSESIKPFAKYELPDSIMTIVTNIWDRKYNNNENFNHFDSLLLSIVDIVDKGSILFIESYVNLVNDLWSDEMIWKRITIKLLASSNAIVLDKTIFSLGSFSERLDIDIIDRLKEIEASKEKHHQTLKKSVRSVLNMAELPSRIEESKRWAENISQTIEDV